MNGRQRTHLKGVIFSAVLAALATLGCDGTLFPPPGSESWPDPAPFPSNGDGSGFSDFTEGSNSGTGAQGSTQPASTVHTEMWRLLNEYRSNNGLDGLGYSTTLETAADAMARDMYQRNFFDHVNPDGDGPLDRAVAAGYDPLMVGENIAYGQRSPEEVTIGWINSEGHRKNMVHTDFTEVGMGYFLAPNQNKYWVQVFGTPR